MTELRILVYNAGMLMTIASSHIQPLQDGILSTISKQIDDDFNLEGAT